MIAFVSGTVAEIRENEVVVDVAGVGYRVIVPSSVIGELQPGAANVTLHTSLITSDDGMRLYGFSTAEARDVFELLITVSGIGPKAGIKLMSMPREKLVEAIAAEDAAMLSTVPGIGPKTAKRVILELKDRIGKLYGSAPGYVPFVIEDGGGDVQAAFQGLQALGYSPSEIRRMMKDAGPDVIKGKNASEIIRICLKKRE